MSDSRKKVLVIDDDQHILDLMVMILGNRYDVLTISNPIKVREQIGIYYPDLIILDLMLPGIDGDALLAQLRAEGVKVPVILFSASYDINNINNISHWVDILEGQAAMSKPFNIVDLISTVDRLVDNGPITT